MNTQGIIYMLLSKLFDSARVKWSQKVLATQRKGSREPIIVDFIRLV